MKIFITLCLAIISSFSLASERKEVCSEQTKVCVSYVTENPFVTNQEGRFLLNLKSSSEVEFLKVDLWMQMGSHGHGSAPLKVTQLDPASFDVTKAYFVMKGSWQIRVSFRAAGQVETLILPVTILQ